MLRKKSYWFNFSFFGAHAQLPNVQCWASVPVGLRYRHVTQAVIDEAKKRANVAPDATLISVSYLGRMTGALFMEGRPTPASQKEGA